MSAGLRLNEIACADALAWCRELPDASVDAWWSSPPYNLEDAFRPGSGQRWDNRWRYAVAAEGARAFGDGCVKPEPEYQAEQVAILTEWHRTLRPDGVAFYNHKVRIKAGRAISPLEWIARTPFVLLQELVWDRGASQNVDPRRFLPVSERIYVLTKRPGLKLDNPERKHDVLRHPANRIPRKERKHPCPTPPAVVRYCLSVVPRPKDRPLVVADCYAGIGTTLLVAQDMGAAWLGCDVAPEYVETARDQLAGPPLLHALPLDLAGAGAAGAVADEAAGE